MVGTALCGVGAAAVAANRAPRSEYPSAAALAQLGLKVDWPLARQPTLVKPGARLVVSVARTHAAARHVIVKLSYARVGSDGQVLQTLAREQLRRGRFSVRVPAARGAHYALTLTVADLRYRGFVATQAPTGTGAPVAAVPASTVTTPAATKPTTATAGGAVASPPSAVSTVPATTTTPSGSLSPPPASGSTAPPAGTPPVPPCAPGGAIYTDPSDDTFAATLTVAVTAATLDDGVPYTLQNTGTGCLSAGAAYAWQRQAGNGSWSNVPMDGIAFPAIAFFLTPGQSSAGAAILPSDAGPGIYRLQVIVSAETNAGPALTLDSVPVAVTAGS